MISNRQVTGNDKGWVPQRGVVKLQTIEDLPGGPVHQAHCTGCSWTYTNVVKADVEQQKAWHLCPPGTKGSLPACPACSSRTSKCVNPETSRPVKEWHADRSVLLAAAGVTS